MKGSSVFWIAGGVIIAGITAYGIYKYFQHQKNDIVEPKDTPDSDHIIIPDIVSDDDLQQETIVTDFQQTQQNTTVSIKERHQVAAQQLKETLGEMEKDSVEFEEKIDQINDDLDKLLE